MRKIRKIYGSRRCKKKGNWIKEVINHKKKERINNKLVKLKRLVWKDAYGRI